MSTQTGSGSFDDHDDESILSTSISEFEDQAKENNTKLNEVVKNLEKQFSVLDKCLASHKKQVKEHKKLEGLLEEYQSNLDEGRPSDALAGFRERLAGAYANENQIDRIIKPVGASSFTRFAMGQVSVRQWREKDKQDMKAEYNKFKFRTSIIFVLFPLAQLLFDGGNILRTLHWVWLLYYYVSMALRESILRVNGSRIHPWWLYHHYVSLVLAVVMMTMSEALMATIVSDTTLKFFVFQGGVMILQYRYQRRRQYARVATGKASPLDIAASETLVEKPQHTVSLAVLMPLCFMSYLFELGFGLSHVVSVIYADAFHWQIPVAGLLWMALGAGNSYTVVSVLQKKQLASKPAAALTKTD